jgi:hypothetical protein
VLGGCLSSALYPLKVDVYKKTRSVDEDTGQTNYRWTYQKTIDAQISPFVSTSFKAQPTNETFREIYDKVEYIKMKTPIPISRDVRVTNIRKTDGQVIYREFELSGFPPTHFNTMGTAPILDPFGDVIQYDTLLQRASDQSDSDV